MAEAIRTRYKSYWFRSRLEARWAAFFDLCEWPWQYEPVDLQGYIPDFILQFTAPLLVEVKPDVTVAAMHAHTAKVEASGWQHEALIVGSGPLTGTNWNRPVLGLLAEHFPPMFSWSWDEAAIFRCLTCHRPSVCHTVQSFRCRVSACYDGDGHIGDLRELDQWWAEAQNRTQWRP